MITPTVVISIKLFMNGRVVSVAVSAIIVVTTRKANIARNAFRSSIGIHEKTFAVLTCVDVSDSYFGQTKKSINI